MKLLAIDTSGDACSAALVFDGAIEQILEIAPRRHGERILPMMQTLLDQAKLRVTDLDALAFGRGPGSFTGVRMATAVIQGCADGRGILGLFHAGSSGFSGVMRYGTGMCAVARAGAKGGRLVRRGIGF